MKRMTRRVTAALLALALLPVVSAQAVVSEDFYEETPGVYHILEETAPSGSALLPRVQRYEGQFPDVREEDWFYAYIAASYEYALINGRDRGFEPNSDITVAELLTLSARIRAAYEGESIPAPVDGEPWYGPYISYLLQKGLLDLSLAAYDVPATRAQLAGIFALSLPEQCYDARNADLVTAAWESGRFLRDVREDTPNQEQILWLYRQGLLNGMDDTGSFWPERTTTRAETAALVTRMVQPDLRITLDWFVPPWYSALGKTLADLVPAPDSVPSDAPSYSDNDTIDALLRQMLASGENTLRLYYPRPLTRSDAATLARVFTIHVKGYCEQMYNTVLCSTYSDGSAKLTFSATACTDEQLARYREEAMERAIEVHDMLWETGQLTKDMSQYEIAETYYRWLCEHCVYDFGGAYDDYSLSHITYSALNVGKAVCDGYTGAYNLFLKLEGISCYGRPNRDHIWTVAVLDGTEYHIDTTWGDQSEEIDMSFFAMSAAESYERHPW